jgi:hypothetical protein
MDQVSKDNILIESNGLGFIFFVLEILDQSNLIGQHQVSKHIFQDIARLYLNRN